jgi:regulator of cell morphogenesis and NO signaling
MPIIHDVKAEWRDKSSKEIIEFIIQHYHQPHRHQLPLLIAQAQNLETSQPTHLACPHGLYQSLADLCDDLLTHMEKEEVILFPLLAAESHSYLCTQLRMAQHHHDGHKQQLELMRQLTHDFTPPLDADDSWRNLYAELKLFYQDLLAHAELEEEVLFCREDTYSAIDAKADQNKTRE